MDNIQKLMVIIPFWYAQKAWAEELLVRVFKLTDASEIMQSSLRGRKPIPGTNWMYFTHGVGVNIYKMADLGGIDFDFDKPDPDPWRLQRFFEKQYNEGNFDFNEYKELFEDEDLFITTAKAILNK